MKKGIYLLPNSLTLCGMLFGFYAILGWDDVNSCYSANLYNRRGEHLHTWVIDYGALDSNGPLNGSDSPHGFAVLRSTFSTYARVSRYGGIPPYLATAPAPAL